MIKRKNLYKLNPLHGVLVRIVYVNHIHIIHQRIECSSMYSFSYPYPYIQDEQSSLQPKRTGWWRSPGKIHFLFLHTACLLLLKGHIVGFIVVFGKNPSLSLQGKHPEQLVHIHFISAHHRILLCSRSHLSQVLEKVSHQV